MLRVRGIFADFAVSALTWKMNTILLEQNCSSEHDQQTSELTLSRNACGVYYANLLRVVLRQTLFPICNSYPIFTVARHDTKRAANSISFRPRNSLGNIPHNLHSRFGKGD